MHTKQPWGSLHVAEVDLVQTPKGASPVLHTWPASSQTSTGLEGDPGLPGSGGEQPKAAAHSKTSEQRMGGHCSRANDPR